MFAVPDGPAVKVIAFVPFPEVSVAFVSVQPYVAPAPALGTETALLVELAQTDAGAVKSVLGNGLTVTFALLVFEHPVAFVTETERVMVPEKIVGVNVIAFVPAPEVIVAFTADQK